MKKFFFIKKLLGLLVILIIPILLSGFLSNAITQHYLKKEIKESNTSLLELTRENIDLIIREVDSLKLYFDRNQLFSITFTRLLEKNIETYEDYVINNTIVKFTKSLADSRPYIHSIYVYLDGANGNFHTTNEGKVNLQSFYDVKWHDSYNANLGSDKIWTEIRQTQYSSFQKESIKVFSICRYIHSSGSGFINGLIVLNIDTSYIENLINRLSTNDKQCIAITDSNNEIIAMSETGNVINNDYISDMSNNENNFFNYSMDGADYVITRLSESNYGLKYFSIVPDKVFFQLSSKLNYITLVLLLLSLVLGIVVAFIRTQTDYRRLNKITSILVAAEEGRKLPPLPSRINDEYGYIISNILKTFIEQSYLKVQLSEKKFKLKSMELMALQSQINPHFLYNTLDTINWKIISMCGKPGGANKMIENLSDILKFSLSSSNELIEIKEEIDNTQNYIEIQKLIFEEKLQCIWDYKHDIKSTKILKLVIQPIIENCIKHGMAQDKKLLIRIRIASSSNTVKISVVDNGRGMSAEKLSEVKQKLENNHDSVGSIGLINTNKRIKLFYGKSYGIGIRSKENMGTAVYVTLPLSQKVK